ncbi:hypothetical protein JMJ77_0000306 [Colletotrichum scovillei]|uniref:Uncharacterized protein n=1 Tax=Colletotrichum scovillei TaxID=1209932 RepID=A0A9P7UEU4_9PEZI|nr:hypothetical protein JMJ77_0000306 [Colletotrichum scovillei]KAG7071510.1 hypothetical protein JMJ76_0004381 [Colletotrichum scovillei]KAG7079759.1 hypothetical protein JMJ78_0006863 [Colletotrichum scovillei]
MPLYISVLMTSHNIQNISVKHVPMRSAQSNAAYSGQQKGPYGRGDRRSFVMLYNGDQYPDFVWDYPPPPKTTAGHCRSIPSEESHGHVDIDGQDYDFPDPHQRKFKSGESHIPAPDRHERTRTRSHVPRRVGKEPQKLWQKEENSEKASERTVPSDLRYAVEKDSVLGEKDGKSEKGADDLSIAADIKEETKRRAEYAANEAKIWQSQEFADLYREKILGAVEEIAALAKLKIADDIRNENNIALTKQELLTEIRDLITGDLRTKMRQNTRRKKFKAKPNDPAYQYRRHGLAAQDYTTSPDETHDSTLSERDAMVSPEPGQYRGKCQCRLNGKQTTIPIDPPPHKHFKILGDERNRGMPLCNNHKPSHEQGVRQETDRGQEGESRVSPNDESFEPTIYQAQQLSLIFLFLLLMLLLHSASANALL